MRIINFGSINLDFVYQVDHFVQPGETMKAVDFHRFAGGKGFNQSIALARAGSPPQHVGQVGEDGRGLVEQLKSEGVDVSRVEIGPAPTGHAIIQVDASGENSILVYGGANREISSSSLEAACSSLNGDDWVLIQNEISGLETIIRLASEQGSRIVFNPSPMEDSLLDLPLEQVDTFLINRSEGEALSGKTTPEHIIEELKRRFPDATLVLTLGAQGVLYANREHEIRVDAQSVEVVDTTGAGDTFAGFFLASLHGGATAEEALQRACRASAICVSRAGAAASIPQESEL
ncbi:MAG: ribokinase [Myxococcota bacterium]|nr:ribokinase [Myxococcota bacterium]